MNSSLVMVSLALLAVLRCAQAQKGTEYGGFCYDKKVAYHNGATIKMDCNTCTCVVNKGQSIGKFACTKMLCPVEETPKLSLPFNFMQPYSEEITRLTQCPFIVIHCATKGTLCGARDCILKNSLVCGNLFLTAIHDVLFV